MSLPPVTSIRKIHDHDIAWIIELWLRIHGGDPVPERIGAAASQIIKGLAVHLPTVQGKAVTAALH
jgi:hypothetical protein